MIKRFFRYIEPIWLGADDKVSIRRVLALAFSVDFILNESYAIRHWVAGQDLGQLSSVLMIEAGLIAALLTLTTWQTLNYNTKSNGNRSNNIVEDNPDAPITGHGGKGSISE